MRTLELVTRLRRKAERANAAGALAQAMRVENVLLLVRDPLLGVLLPAPGMPATVRGGRSWREFLVSCPEQGRYAGHIELPKGTSRDVLALMQESTALVLVGGAPDERQVCELERLMPLLAALLGTEQEAVLSRADAVAARESAKRAETLATALEAARADASALNAELRDEHRRKDEFLAMLGHELRNPLSPLVTSMELLRRLPRGSAMPAPLISVMGRQIAQLSRLVEDLLDVSRVSLGKIELKRDVVLLRDIIDGALEESRALIDSKQHRVVLEGCELPLSVNGDHARLVQVFGNLLNNAAKYTEPGGTISVTLQQDRQNAVVSIEDTGIGIDPEIQRQIFELFAQAPGGFARALGGLGIGLTLVRTLVERHGGQVSVSSRGSGCGSTFIVTLPIVKRRPLPEHERAHRTTTARVERRLRVFIVDDNRDAADSMAALLTAMGHDVEVAYDAAAALQSPVTSAVDLIFLDIGLPDLDGYELARRLKPIASRAARFIALTGYGTDEGKRRSKETGFERHVVKPLAADALANLVEESLRAS